MADFEVRYDKDGKRRFKARVRVAPFPTETITFDRKEDAVAWADFREAELRRMKQLGMADEQLLAAALTVGYVIDQFIEQKIGAHRKDYQTIRFHFDWWKNALGNRKLSLVTPGVIDDAVYVLKAEPCANTDINGNPIAGLVKNPDGTPRVRSPRTVQYYIASLSLIFRYAVKKRWVAYNPVRDVEKPKVRNKRDRYLSPDAYLFPGEDVPRTWSQLTKEEKQRVPSDAYELPRFLEACANQHRYFAYHPEWLFNLVWLRLATGVRPSEARNLKWSQVDLIGQKFVLHETKNGKPIAVPLEGMALDIMKEMHKYRRGDSDFVFPRKDGKAALSFRKRFARALKDANIADFRPHDIRHTAASYLAMQGCSPKEVAAVLNQSSTQIAERYMHLSPSHTRQKVQRMNEVFLDRRLAAGLEMTPEADNDNDEPVIQLPKRRRL